MNLNVVFFDGSRHVSVLPKLVSMLGDKALAGIKEPMRND
jgi:hypothetical protein